MIRQTRLEGTISMSDDFDKRLRAATGLSQKEQAEKERIELTEKWNRDAPAREEARLYFENSIVPLIERCLESIKGIAREAYLEVKELSYTVNSDITLARRAYILMISEEGRNKGVTNVSSSGFYSGVIRFEVSSQWHGELYIEIPKAYYVLSSEEEDYEYHEFLRNVEHRLIEAAFLKLLDKLQRGGLKQTRPIESFIDKS